MVVVLKSVLFNCTKRTLFCLLKWNNSSRFWKEKSSFTIMDQVQELSDALPMPKLPSFHVEINQCGYRYMYLCADTHCWVWYIINKPNIIIITFVSFVRNKDIKGPFITMFGLFIQQSTNPDGSDVLIWKLTDSQGPILADTGILF